MPQYMSDITEPLIRVLDHISALPVYQIAGHAVNLPFWIQECRHCIDVVDGYNTRFSKLREGENTFVELHRYDREIKRQIRGRSGNLRRSMKDADLKALRHRLLKSAERMITRCCSEKLIDRAKAEEYCTVLGIGTEGMFSEGEKGTGSVGV